MTKVGFIFFIIFIMLLGTGCGKFERFTATWTGYSELCVDGVKYIQFTSGASVKYNQNGTIVTCQ